MAISVLAAGALADEPRSVESPTHDLPLAFPGAEGFGRFAQGGRGGDVYHVTNLADDGPGSLREGIRSAHGPRTIVFDVSGTIQLLTPLTIDKSFLTIAGQTAPGDGICLRDQSVRVRQAQHVVLRYLRFRLGDQNKPRPSGPDCLSTDDIDQVIFDHLTVTWGIDSNHDLRRGGNFTLQWSIYAEALNHSLHEKGAHAMLGSFRDLTGGVTLHHNLLASCRERHPTLGGSPRTRPDAVVDFRNTLVYNLTGATNLGNCQINVIRNLYRPGPDTLAHGLPLATKFENAGALRVFLEGNVFEGRPELTADNHLAIDFERWTKGSYRPTTWEEIRAPRPFEIDGAEPITESAHEACERVLQQAGASHPRDAADARLVAAVRDGSHRLIDSQDQVGGWPALRSQQAPPDADQDGMPDAWEQHHGLDPDDATDRNGDLDHDGYTNLEQYLNGLVSEDVGTQTP